MESSENNPQLELLAKIHNHLVDIKQIMVATQSAAPGVGDALKKQLHALVENDQHIDGGHTGNVVTEHQKVIAPENTDITAGEARDQGGGK